MSYPTYGTSRIKCANNRCKWKGTEKDLVQVPSVRFKNTTEGTCPKCGGRGYYFDESPRGKVGASSLPGGAEGRDL